MSETSTRLSDQHFAYLAERTLQDDAFLRALRSAAQEARIPAISIAPEQASFMQILLKLSAARNVVEVGTLAGYSAISMARALPHDGRVVTIEVSGKHADFAREWVARSDVADRVQVLLGDARQLLRKLGNETMDAAFIDADKVNYGAYLAECLRIVRRGGMIIVDNAFAFGQILDPAAAEESVQAVRAFNEHMARDERVQSIIVPLGDGCWIGVRL